MKCFNASMLFLASILLPSMLMGQVIVSDQNVILYPDVTDGDTTNFEIGVFQDAAATDITHTLFGLTGSELVITGMSRDEGSEWYLSLIHISEPTRRYAISYAVFCLKKKK